MQQFRETAFKTFHNASTAKQQLFRFCCIIFQAATAYFIALLAEI